MDLGVVNRGACVVLGNNGGLRGLSWICRSVNRAARCDHPSTGSCLFACSMRCAGSVNRQLLVSWERPRVAWSLMDLGPDQITHDENACDNARIVLGQTTTPQLRLFLMRRCEGLSGPTKHILCLRSRGDPPTNVAASWLACAHQAPRIATGGRCQLLVKLPTAVGQVKPNKAAPPPIPRA